MNAKKPRGRPPVRTMANLERWTMDQATGVRNDGWQNRYTGQNIAGRDPMVSGVFYHDMLDTQSLNELYFGNDLARRIIDGIVFDSTRAGYTVVLEEADPDEIKALTTRADALRIDEKVFNALVWARLYGGAGLLLGVQDMVPMVEPLNPEAQVDFTYLRPIDKRYAFSIFWNENPMSPDYGDPAIWMVGSYTGPFAYVHTSRFIPIHGIATDEVTKRRLQGWGYPVLQPVYEVLRGLQTAEHSAIQIMATMNQDVFKINGLIQAIGSGNAAVVSERMHAVDMRKSTNQSIVLDKEQEEMERLAGNIPPGVQPILEHLMYRISAAADMPVNILFGRTPGGMNATGKFDTDTWHNRVQSFQKTVLRPIYLRVFSAIARSMGIDPEGIDIQFTALRQEDPAAEADTNLKEAQTNQIHHDMGAVSPNEIRDHLKAKGKMKLSNDVDADDQLQNPTEDKEADRKAASEALKAKTAGGGFGGPPGAKGAGGGFGGPPGAKGVKQDALVSVRQAWYKLKNAASAPNNGVQSDTCNNKQNART